MATTHFLQPNPKRLQPLRPSNNPALAQAHVGWRNVSDSVHFGSQPTDKPQDALANSEHLRSDQSQVSETSPSLLGRLSQGTGLLLGKLGHWTWQATKLTGKALALPFVWMTKLAMKPFEKLQPKQRLKNAVNNAIGYPRHQKLVKAGIWAGATFAIGCIPIPGFQALIAAAPVTFLTTLLVDFSVGFVDGLTKDPDKMREFLDNWKQQA